ncbi:MAG: FAD binding domain-containing protein [bacterium]|nr:FAD binding domain-containing protein [bacterium]MDE0674181.1 FAD binding domain-containing protein [bacterium]
MHEVQRRADLTDRYESPSLVEEALSLLARHRHRARLVAGGTDLVLEVRRGVRSGVEVLVDISRIAGLDNIRQDAGGVIHLGPLVTHADVVSSDLIRSRALPLAQASLEVGAPPLQARSTVVGNLVTASPANDTISALTALDARLDISSERGDRQEALADFYPGIRRTTLAPDEMVTGVSFRGLEADQTGVFVKLGLRMAQAISVVHMALVVERDAAGVTTMARIALGSVAPVIVRSAEAERELMGRRLDEPAIVAAAQAAARAINPIDDLRGTADYRRWATEVMVRRALTALADGSERRSMPSRPVHFGASRRATLTKAHSHREGDPIEAVVNGTPVVTRSGGELTLLDWLRDVAGPAAGVSLTGTKEGCAEGECGACLVFLDSEAALSCLTPAPRAHGAEIVTVEGLGAGGMSPVQAAFCRTGAVQCGYCTPGFLMSATKLLERLPAPTTDEIVTALSGNLCRCTGYYSIIEAVSEAAASASGGSDGGSE